MAQVKAVTVKSPEDKILTILGGAWKVQEEKIKAGIYHPLYVVKVVQGKPVEIDYIAADFLNPEMYRPRKALSSQARRAGWQGFYYDLRKLDEHVMVEVWSSPDQTTIEKKVPKVMRPAMVTKLDSFSTNVDLN